MANAKPSDMLSRRLYLAALRMQSPSTPLAPRPSGLSLLDLAGLSTCDKPAAPTLEENKYYDKYREKLTKLKSERPAEFKQAVDKVYKQQRGDGERGSGERGGADTTNLQGSSDVRGSSVLESMKRTSRENPGASEAAAKQRPGLDSIMKLDLLEDKSPSQISAIWSEFLSKKDGVIYATVPVEKYARLKAKGGECPLFVYALARESGYEFVLGQCNQDDWYYTPLIQYQSHGEYAPYSLAVRHYTELADSKGLVLMKGEIASDDLKPELASLLVHQTQLMYGSDDNFELVTQMNKNPDAFDHMRIIDVCKKYGLF